MLLNAKKLIWPQTIATGGGKPSFVPDPTLELILPIINTKSVVGLENRFDSDGIIDNNDRAVEVRCATTDWGDYTVKDLQQPMNISLQNIQTDPNTCDINTGTGTTRDNQSENTTWAKRRRPNIPTLTSSHLTKQYSELAAIKLEVANMQKEILTMECNWKKEEIALQKQSLLLDIKIKEA